MFFTHAMTSDARLAEGRRTAGPRVMPSAITTLVAPPDSVIALQPLSASHPALSSTAHAAHTPHMQAGCM